MSTTFATILFIICCVLLAYNYYLNTVIEKLIKNINEDENQEQPNPNQLTIQFEEDEQENHH